MVRINREDMHVTQRFMPVQVRMRLRPLPTFVLMLVVFVMDMQVLVSKRDMEVLQLGRFTRGPDR